MKDYLLLAKEGKTTFGAFLVCICLTVLALIVSSNIAPVYYLVATKNKGLTLEDLLDYFGKNTFFLLQLAPFACSLIILMLGIKLIHKRKIRSLFTSRPAFGLKRFLLSFLLWGGMLSLFLIYQLVFTDAEIKWNFVTPGFWYLFGISLVFVTIQTLFEEALFRGYLLQAFALVFKHKWIPLFVSSLLFALLHANNPEIDVLGKEILLYFFATGLFLALLSYYDNGLELAFGFHAANNLFGALILTNNWQVFQTDALYKDCSPPETGWEIWIYVCICYPLLFLLYRKIYKWKTGSIFAVTEQN